MKLLLLFLVPLLFLCEGCKKDSPLDLRSQFYEGDATAIKNEENWSAWVRLQNHREGNIITDGQFILIMDVFSVQESWRKSLSISRINRTNDSQVILSASYYTLDEDVVVYDYALDTLATDNFIQITDIDTAAMEISGLFNVSLILKRKENWTNPPTTIRFTKGKFTIKVEQEWFE